LPTIQDAAADLTTALVNLITAASQRPEASNALLTPPSWRERLWDCPADTRLGVLEICEALGRSKAFVYRLTRTKDIPHRKLDGELVFRAGDIRAWVQQREDVQVTPRLTIVGRKS
jgi:predicted DNA-binding transcriptional regulator AlpA